jgi:hypothetical protein
VEVILNVDGAVSYDHDYNKSAAERRRQRPPAQVWLRNLLGKDFFSSVTYVSLASAAPPIWAREEWPYADDLAEKIGTFTELTDLDLTETHITDAGLEHLKGLHRIESLNLSGNSEVTDAGIQYMQGFANLAWLGIDGTQVTDVGLEYLKRLPNLRALNLGDTKVTGEGVKRFQQALPNCDIIY